MPFFSSLPDDAGVRHVLTLNPRAGRALVDFHTAVLRQPSALSEGERELIAAYVSALNQCRYCAGVHGATAEAFGVEPDLLARMVDDLDGAGIDERLLPIMRYARKLTLEPARMVQADAEAVLAAGWDERALHDAVNVIALFNFMNRLVEGHGIKGAPAIWTERARALHQAGYEPIRDLLASA
ncbi:MAG: alkyl hydroperoxide reductase AhpD [Alphaproteobacteria bacterium]|nr:MAG: alkyl hydroperoxide reductase AhpD [Alphaproteobacteria bacterium]